MQENQRMMFTQRVWAALKTMLVGAILTYLGLLFWFEVHWFLGVFTGAIGVLTFSIGVQVGLAKSTGYMALDGIEGALRSGKPKLFQRSVHETVGRLHGDSLNRQSNQPLDRRYKAMEETVLVWNPLYDKVVQLFVETIDGELPSLQTGPGGKPLISPEGGHGRYHVDGGWPCQRYTAAWREEAQEVLAQYHRQRVEHQFSNKPLRGNFSRLRNYLQACVEDPRRLSGADVGMVRLILAGIATKRGLPESRLSKDTRGAQERYLMLLRRKLEAKSEGIEKARSVHQGMSQLLISRLQNFKGTAGLDDPDSVLGPVTPEEASKFGLESGQTIPRRFGAIVRLSRTVPLTEVVNRGFVPSQAILVRMVRQLVPSIRPYYLDDRVCNNLWGAFRLIQDEPMDGPALCPRCGKPIEAGTFSCRSCARSLNLVRPLWHGAMSVFVSVAIFGGVLVGLKLAD